MNMSRVSVYCRVRPANGGILDADNDLLRVSNEKVHITSDFNTNAHSKANRQQQYHHDQEGYRSHSNVNNKSGSVSFTDKTASQDDDRDVEKISPGQEYTFDEVFTDNSSNSHVFAQTTAQIIKGAILNGISATIMSYGEHNSGKTYTMFGNTAQLPSHPQPTLPFVSNSTTSSHSLSQLPKRTGDNNPFNKEQELMYNYSNGGGGGNVNSNLGLAQLSILYLFQLMEQTQHECSYMVSVSFVQLIGEEVIDLLSSSSSSSSSSSLSTAVQDIKTHDKNKMNMQRPLITLDDKGQVCLKNIEEVKCTNAIMAMDALQRGLVNGKRRQQLKFNTKNMLLWSSEHVKHKNRDQHLKETEKDIFTNVARINNNNNNNDHSKSKNKSKNTLSEMLPQEQQLLLPCHYIFFIHVKSQMLQESDAQWKSATLHCVDLASPQRLDTLNEFVNNTSTPRSNSELRRIAQLTNRSLSTLEQVLRRVAINDNFNNGGRGSVRFADSSNGNIGSKRSKNTSFHSLDNQFSDLNTVMYYDHYDDDDDDNDNNGDKYNISDGVNSGSYNNKRLHNVNSYAKKDVNGLTSIHNYRSPSRVTSASGALSLSESSSSSFASRTHNVKVNKVVSSPIPYRQSKLTLLLKDSLSGSCVNVVIAHILTPTQHDHKALDGVMSTLNFARRAQRITINPTTHIIKDAQAQVKELERQVKDLKTELRLQSQLIRQKHEEQQQEEEKEEEEKKEEALQLQHKNTHSNTDEAINYAQSGKPERNKRQQVSKNDAHSDKNGRLINSTNNNNNKRPPLATKPTSSTVNNTVADNTKNKNEDISASVGADSKVEMTNRLRNFFQGKSVSLRLGSVAEMNYCFGELRNMLEDKEEIINKLEREHAELIRLAAEIEANEKRNKLSGGNVASSSLSSHSSSANSNVASASNSRLNRERRTSVNTTLLPPSPLSVSSTSSSAPQSSQSPPPPLTASEMLSSKLSMILKGKEEVRVSPSVLDSSTGVGYGMSKKASSMLHSTKDVRQAPLNNKKITNTPLLHELNLPSEVNWTGTTTTNMFHSLQNMDEGRPRSPNVTQTYYNVPITTEPDTNNISEKASLPSHQMQETSYKLPPVRPHSAQIIHAVDVPTNNRPYTSSITRPHTMPTYTSNSTSFIDVSKEIASLHSLTAEERELLMEMKRVIYTAKIKSSRSITQIISEDTELQNTLRHMAFDVYKTTKPGKLQTRVIYEQQTLVDEKAIELNQLHRKANMLHFELEKRQAGINADSDDNLPFREEMLEGEEIEKFNKLQQEQQYLQHSKESNNNNNANHESFLSLQYKDYRNRPQTAMTALHGEMTWRRAVSSEPAAVSGGVFSSTWNGAMRRNLPFELSCTPSTFTNSIPKVSSHSWNSEHSDERLSSAYNQHAIWLQSQINFVQNRIDTINSESKELQQELIRRQRLLLINFDEWHRHLLQTLLQILIKAEQQEQEQKNAELYLSRLNAAQVNVNHADQETTNQSSTAVHNEQELQETEYLIPDLQK